MQLSDGHAYDSILANGKLVGKLLVSRSALTDTEGQMGGVKMTGLGSLSRAGTDELSYFCGAPFKTLATLAYNCLCVCHLLLSWVPRR